MLNGFTNVAITKDLTDDILKSLDDLAKKTICVGVPEEENTMHDDIANAELLYIHTHGVRDTKMRRAMQHDLDSGTPYSKAHELYVHENGSPLWNTPPRPVLEPAIDNSKDEIAKQMKKAVEAALDGHNAEIELEKVGTMGQNSARDWFTNPSNNWPANSEDTIRRKGSDRPLIDKGQLRKSIIFTIKDGEY
ncbi:hypothetical protein DP145_01740 [Clostridium tetani]|uniref:hypothetical protein n=1 Tax=Clostridium tetani TaxID=1513 RepID=UPI00100A5B33|nr:hypothetical protein [Clostridium tetani]RXI46086.1 hypothetical protein DP126_07820 [Clostridium tetani]RXM61478.1 hypothetical protein DP138_04655 [Clostridium tetani]RXM70303.1 hypothetical protein DP145_01740 [Clostridium tetani]